MKHKASLASLLAMAASLFGGMRNLMGTTDRSADSTARSRHGKRGGGSGYLRRLGHPLFQRRRISYAQPEGYYTQGIDRRHIHSYGPFQSPEILKVKGSLPRATFKQ